MKIKLVDIIYLFIFESLSFAGHSPSACLHLRTGTYLESEGSGLLLSTVRRGDERGGGERSARSPHNSKKICFSWVLVTTSRSSTDW
jgi:hypothetical protein